MLSHIHVGTNAFSRAFDFYSAVLGTLGWQLRFSEPEKGWAGWQFGNAERPLFLVGIPYDQGLASSGNGQMVGLLAPNRGAVDACYAQALVAGGTNEGPPGLRPQYHAYFYGAYFRDPDGNKLCVCCHDPVSEGVV
ncbi:MAG: VOC family protein [Burkholderiaceae bacterium]|jgi:catechol 2,3-dioxygenase-like lactoylglutathione lyase family enzyme